MEVDGFWINSVLGFGVILFQFLYVFVVRWEFLGYRINSVVRSKCLVMGLFFLKRPSMFFFNGDEPYFRKTGRIPGFHTIQIQRAPSWNEQPVCNRHQECQTLVTLAWTPGSYVENIIEVPSRWNTFRHLFAIVLSISGYHLSTSTVAFTQIQKTPRQIPRLSNAT